MQPQRSIYPAIFLSCLPLFATYVPLALPMSVNYYTAQLVLILPAQSKPGYQIYPFRRMQKF